MDKERVLVELSDCVEILEDIDSAEYTKAELGGLHGSVLSTIMDALELLKAQEPRVMTLEEAQKAEYVYLETRKWVDGDYHGTAKHKDTEFSDCLTEFVDGYGCVLSCDNAMYGDNWRCWTSMPTDAQRDATPWN